MSLFRLAVAARYQDRDAVVTLLRNAKIDTLALEVTASWLSNTAGSDSDVSLNDAQKQVVINRREIILSHALLYLPCWNINFKPEWSPGRLIDVGIAMAMGLPVIVCGRREPSLYFNGYQPLRQCWPDELHDALAELVERHTA